ncbi:MAG: hypothetical protein WCN95_13620 [bacterium]
MKRVMAGLVMCFCVAGCMTRYPMGLTQQQWEALPPAQQAEYQAKQYAIDEDRRKQAESQRMEQDRLRQQQEQAAQERVRQIYANARYGDIVQVAVEGGSIEYAGKHYPYEPVAFDLAKGETKEIAFSGRGLQTIATRYNVRLTEDGNTIYFDGSFRERIVLVNQDWERGQTYRPNGTRNDVSVSISGMTFFVKFKELPGAPQRVIIEHRGSGQRPELRR